MGVIPICLFKPNPRSAASAWCRRGRDWYPPRIGISEWAARHEHLVASGREWRFGEVVVPAAYFVVVITTVGQAGRFDPFPANQSLGMSTTSARRIWPAT